MGWIPYLKLIGKRLKQQKSAYWSLKILLWIMTIITSLEFIANDKPLIISYNHTFYLPVLYDYPETTFGGEFETSTQYLDPYVQRLIQQKGWMIWPFLRYSYDTVNYNLKEAAPSPPSRENWLGTDDQGRDILARLLYGLKTSLFFGVSFTLLSGLIGTLLGVIQGYFGGKVDFILQRFTEIWTGLPIFFLLMFLGGIVEISFEWLLGVMIALKWPLFVPFVRAEVLRARNLPYVKTAEMLGVSSWKIMLRHISPKVMGVLMTYFGFAVSGALTLLATLDFLGLGLPSEVPSLGEILNQGKNNLHAPWIGVSAFLTLAGVLSLLILVAEGFKIAVNPQFSEMEVSS
jgi:microcin C transport system permease protein